MNQYIQNKQTEFNGLVDFFKKEISSLRTGRANPALLENVKVEAYGVINPINAVGNVNVVDASSLTITPWDKSVTKNIEKALVEANLGLGIVNEGDKIRLTVPAMTEENRKDLVKKLNERQEKVKISLRQLRDEVKGAIEDAEKNKEINEDDKFRFIKELDEEVTTITTQIKDLRDKKESDIMSI
ncbi:MAG: ribosome recycling factor [Planctomycetes bacterium]|jgi:ribosome recycling factor|nr:ribosome recycling factor [Planctomycetota bacterium]